MQEEGEDVKPKLNIIIDYEGQSQPFSVYCWVTDNDIPTRRLCGPLACTVKVKPGMLFQKVFDAAEVHDYFDCTRL